MILPFELDPQIIHHIIYSQAGSIGKAIIELLMNSVDASATGVRLSMTKDGFNCRDDGKGFASRNDVVRYFGRFGTPHEEGDATYGRFRLGRGQIMAHASTEWLSHYWKMTVDTRSMGYSYDLEDLPESTIGCFIMGRWYDPLTDSELMSAVQEIRDLVRYTPVSVELNGKVITRDPEKESWDFQDEFAYYRAKAEGPLSIYNQGVLVRHDSSHIWGAGGLIVSKKAIALNVSRTDILRKTCSVWKPIAKQFAAMAESVTARMGDHRKTEARREKSARALLSGDPNILELYEKEEVITLLPGKRHVTLANLLRHAHNRPHNGKITVIENAFDVPKGEAIARASIALVVHPQTLDRFGCYSPEDFREVLERIIDNVKQTATTKPSNARFYGSAYLHVPELVAFSVLREAFVERTSIVSEKNALDKETRRAWTALRWCLQQYAGVCAGEQSDQNGRLHWLNEHRLTILLGESNTAEAWTDGKTYLAINKRNVEKLKTDPLTAAAFIFGLVEHEVAHQGDSIDCGHDEAFYQRFHDISIHMSPVRQQYIHRWLMKYTYSMEGEGKKALRNIAWRERRLVERVGNGRQKRGLPGVIEDVSSDPLVTAHVPEENMAFVDHVNTGLVLAGVCPPPPDWNEVIERARQEQLRVVKENSNLAAEETIQEAMQEAAYEAWRDEEMRERKRFVEVLGVSVEDISDLAFDWMYQVAQGGDDVEIRRMWESKGWEQPDYDEDEFWAEADAMQQQTSESRDPRPYLDEKYWPLLQEGESWWSLERNTAAAGFFDVPEYLKWRVLS